MKLPKKITGTNRQIGHLTLLTPSKKWLKNEKSQAFALKATHRCQDHAWQPLPN
jgi:hypothetical protein